MHSGQIAIASHDETIAPSQSIADFGLAASAEFEDIHIRRNRLEQLTIFVLLTLLEDSMTLGPSNVSFSNLPRADSFYHLKYDPAELTLYSGLSLAINSFLFGQGSNEIFAEDTDSGSEPMTYAAVLLEGTEEVSIAPVFKALSEFEYSYTAEVGITNLVRHVTELLGLVIGFGHRPVVAFEVDDGELEIEVRLNPDELLLLSITPEGLVDALIDSSKSGYVPVKEKSMAGLIELLRSPCRLVQAVNK